MASRTAKAKWQGTLNEGEGTLALGSGAFEGRYTWESRAGRGESADTNPEELLGASHAGCFTMTLAANLVAEGHVPDALETEAKVGLRLGDEGPYVSRIRLFTRGRVPGVDQAAFEKAAEAAKQNCPISKALAAVAEITVEPTLES
jgi:lipoyl-dependent peroxiredoxin